MTEQTPDAPGGERAQDEPITCATPMCGYVVTTVSEFCAICNLKHAAAASPRPAEPSTLHYRSLLPKLREIARANGYALAVHGSEIRDFDLVAVPWTLEAVRASVLAEALREACGGYYKAALLPGMICETPEIKEHGRLAWSIYLHHDEPGVRERYIDLSVIPAHASDLVNAHTWALYNERVKSKARPAEPEPPKRACCEPAPDRSGRKCNKPLGHDGQHWTYGGHELRWDSRAEPEPPMAEPEPTCFRLCTKTSDRRACAESSGLMITECQCDCHKADTGTEPTDQGCQCQCCIHVGALLAACKCDCHQPSQPNAGTLEARIEKELAANRAWTQTNDGLDVAIDLLDSNADALRDALTELRRLREDVSEARAGEDFRDEMEARRNRQIGTCSECHQPIKADGSRTVENREDSPEWHSWCYARIQKARADALETRASSPDLRGLVEK